MSAARPRTEGMDQGTRRSTEVECLVPDMAGIPRGKILTRRQVPRHHRQRTLPPARFRLRPEWSPATTPRRGDDLSVARHGADAGAETIRIVPWYKEPTAQVSATALGRDGVPVSGRQRQVMKTSWRNTRRGMETGRRPGARILSQPEEPRSDYPLQPGRESRAGPRPAAKPRHRCGQRVRSLVEDPTNSARRRNLDRQPDPRGGVAQCEINFNHGNPLDLADQSFLFKRTVRQAAMRHDIYATFHGQAL